MQRKEEKKAQAQVRLKERNKLRLEIARQAIPVADGDEDEELSNAVVEDINVEGWGYELGVWECLHGLYGVDEGHF